MYCGYIRASNFKDILRGPYLDIRLHVTYTLKINVANHPHSVATSTILNHKLFEFIVVYDKNVSRLFLFL